MLAIADTDALLGLTIENDIHYKTSSYLFKKLSDIGCDTFILPTTLSEFALLATGKIGMGKTREAVKKFSGDGSSILTITPDLTAEALQIYNEQTSKEESLFDCFVMASARSIFADCILSFDRGYIKNGFILAEDFVRQRKN